MFNNVRYPGDTALKNARATGLEVQNPQLIGAVLTLPYINEPPTFPEATKTFLSGSGLVITARIYDAVYNDYIFVIDESIDSASPAITEVTYAGDKVFTICPSHEGETIICTALELVKALRANDTFSAIFCANLPDGDDGSGVVDNSPLDPNPIITYADMISKPITSNSSDIDLAVESILYMPRINNVSLASSAYTIVESDIMVRITSGANNVQLPTATGSRRRIVVTNHSASSVGLKTDGTDTLNGSNTKTLAQYATAQVVDCASGVWALI